MRIRWTTEASDQLIGIVQHIEQEDPSAARNVAQAVIDAIDRLGTFPYLGRPGELKGTRELVSAPYVVVYRVTSEVVEILHIWHGAQDWR
ncbi:MAG: type II toxin-antitoxin system RelE/ParE family toxin [Bryobacteraceae bacterium]|jgi:toxin ParE1/3/4